MVVHWLRTTVARGSQPLYRWPLDSRNPCEPSVHGVMSVRKVKLMIPSDSDSSKRTFSYSQRLGEAVGQGVWFIKLLK